MYSYALRLCAIALVAVSAFFVSDLQAQQLVRFDSVLGKFDVELYENTPLTKANFLSYVDAGDYTNTFIHRSANLMTGEPFVIQGGGFRYEDQTFSLANQRPPVLNEPFNPNIRGTIALAKLGAGPDPVNSGTNQWFISTRDNRSILDGQNGGFTAFGLVQGDGLDVVDALKAVPIVDGSSITSAFGELPVIDFVNDGNFDNELLIFTQIVRTPNALGDLDGSGGITGADIDLLYDGYGPTPANDIDLDLDSSGQVDDLDRDRLIERIAGTRLGDFDFDQKVDVFSDGFALLNNLGVSSNSTYAQGDLNGDGVVDIFNDGFKFLENLGFDGTSGSSSVSRAGTAAVPEPGTLSLFSVLLAGSVAKRRRRV